MILMKDYKHFLFTTSSFLLKYSFYKVNNVKILNLPVLNSRLCQHQSGFYNLTSSLPAYSLERDFIICDRGKFSEFEVRKRIIFNRLWLFSAVWNTLSSIFKRYERIFVSALPQGFEPHNLVCIIYTNSNFLIQNSNHMMIPY